MKAQIEAIDDRKKPWLAEYPPEVPAEIDTDEFASLREIIEKSCAQYRDRPAYTNMGVSLTYADIDEKSRNFAAYLQRELELEKGERVCLMMPNVLQYPVALFGILRAGLTAVNVNPLYTAPELEHQLTDCGARAIVILENFAHTLQEVLPKTSVKTVITTQVGDLLGWPKSMLVNFAVKHVKKLVPHWNIPGYVSMPRALTIGSRRKFMDREITHDDIAFLQYTGGTTGVAKGAMLTHGNMIANLQQASAWLRPMFGAGRQIIITALPLYHIFALTANCLTFMKNGGENILITNPRDFAGFVRELKSVDFTAITGVNTLFNALLNTPGFSDVGFRHLGFTLGGGMAVQRAVAERWKEVTGHALVEAYGLTETSPAACMNPITATEFSGAIGLPISSTDVSIRDDDGKELPLGEIGELCIHGPQVMAGYWQRPDETAKVMLEGGWLRTGDMARLDERGYVFIEDRKKDMILVSGFNVYPNEVENVVMAQGGVLEAAAIGVPNERSGETVKVFVVKSDPGLTADEIIAHCRANLAGYKVPKLVEFRDELPKTNVGKIQRRALREEATAP